MSTRVLRFICIGTAVAGILATGGIMTMHATNPATAAPLASASTAPATADDARRFVESAEARLMDLGVQASRASWVHENFITDDTEKMAADAGQALQAATAELASQATKFDGLKLPEDVSRKLMLLKHAVDIPTPRNPAEQTELAQILASLDGDYGRGKWCPDSAAGGGERAKCLSLGDMENILATSQDPKELLAVWRGWHSIAPPMRKRYERMVVLANEGARDMGFPDVGDMWRAGYDMPPDAFGAELDRLWQQVRPLYVSLHAYVRSQLVKKYGAEVVRAAAPIPRSEEHTSELQSRP